VTAPLPAIQAKTAIEWLAYIEALHPKAIAMGLNRVKKVLEKLQLSPSFPIITVAGTNGKGSVCAMLSQIYVQAGYRVGTYTSPHIHRYNERVNINLQSISDQDLCAAFVAVEAARADVDLTYFEMGTLAAMWHFCSQKLDVAILEIGLGGRLDAVNAFEPTCSIVTTIDLDHMEFLGDTRELIGLEKAGVFRANKLAICGDENPPKSLIEYARLNWRFPVE
jgi:dihydrofolate synthase / folylpolyglutamate synthase